ncbi:MAG TPA: cobalamin-independent methionine synthase II family protein [Solirubrobacteraceae bacterium]|jgi:5-methyltetrahydropteroyltriglutamate--homocysteine methyltransferase|nr:cobalamin-independent methionine synthase II family protein [Solirubrobacteraceae bacterium]
MTRSQHSLDRLLTTHVGSLPRAAPVLDRMAARYDPDQPTPPDYDACVTAAVRECVAHQVEVGLDVVSDGEQSKPGFFAYARSRMTGLQALEGEPTMSSHAREFAAFPEYYERYLTQAMLGGTVVPVPPAFCTGPVAYTGHDELRRDIANMTAAIDAARPHDAFMPSVSPSGLARNRHYAGDEEFYAAAGEALRTEYLAIVDAGLNLQVDDPSMISFFADDDVDPAEQERRAYAYVEILNHALRDIPPERIRYHVCYGINEGPRVFDVPFIRFVKPMLAVNAGAYTFEAGNPRHEHEYHLWEDVTLPEGKVLLPGVVAHASNIVEHPEVIAERLVNFARLVGRENVVASVDCGFSSQATYQTEVHPTVIWAKFEALRDGAALASQRLWR